MSFLDDVKAPQNLQEPEFGFLVENLFSPLDSVRKETLGSFRNITAKKMHIIAAFIKKFRIHIGDDIYPSARLILPNKDRRKYYIRDVVLARLIIKILNIPKDSEDYNLLFNWKRNYHRHKHFGSDFRSMRSLPLIISRIISNRRVIDHSEPPKNKITVTQLNKFLNDLVGASKSEEQVSILKPLVLTLSIEELRWLFTIILRISILTIFESYFFEQWHPDGVKLFQVCNDLYKTFGYLTDRDKRLSEDQLLVHPMLPFLPQLSHKLIVDYERLCAKMRTYFEMNDDLTKEYNEQRLKNKFLIEEKMDGDRMVLHMNNLKFKFFSRRLKDYTLLYGENLQIGSLTKYLSNAFKPGVKSVILDGEMVAWDFKRNVILPFGTLRSSAIQEAVKQFTTTDQYMEQSSYPLFVVFDILHLNGKNLTNLPLFYRKSILNKIINEVPHRFEVLETHMCSSSDDIKHAIKSIVSQRSEGIMVKHLQSKYKINHRSHNWVKIKPEYLEQFGENLDLVVIGMEPGIKNSFMLSLRDKNDVYNSFCMVANGFTNTEFEKIERLTHNKWISFKSKKPPPNILFGTKKTTYWIHPENSIVLEIKARSIDCTSDSSYAVGSSLHNLYCRSIREDKLPEDCITLEEYKEMKLKYSESNKTSQSVNKKRRTNNDSFLENYNRNRSININIKSMLFNNFRFLILTDQIDKDGNRITVVDLKKLVKKFGGTLVSSPYHYDDAKQMLIISEVLSPICEVYLKNGFDLIKPKWIFECIKRNAIIQLEPTCIFRTNNYFASYLSSVDEFGDSWIVHGDIDQNLNFEYNLTDAEIKTGEEEIRTDFRNEGIPDALLFLFNGIKFYVIEMECKLYSERVIKRIERFGGATSLVIDECSYIVVPKEANSNFKFRFKALEKVQSISKRISEKLVFDSANTLISKIPNVVTEEFLTASITHNVLVDANDFKFS